MPEVEITRVRIIRPGISERFRAQPLDRVLHETQRLGLPDRYILHVGTIEPRKNLVTLVEAYRAAILAGDITKILCLPDVSAGITPICSPSSTPRICARAYTCAATSTTRTLPMICAGRATLHLSVAMGRIWISASGSSRLRCARHCVERLSACRESRGRGGTGVAHGRARTLGRDAAAAQRRDLTRGTTRTRACPRGPISLGRDGLGPCAPVMRRRPRDRSVQPSCGKCGLQPHQRAHEFS